MPLPARLSAEGKAGVRWLVLQCHPRREPCRRPRRSRPDGRRTDRGSG